MEEKKIIIVGASAKRSRFSNKAVRAFRDRGWIVYPVHPSEQEIEGIACYPSVGQVPDRAEWMSLYVLPPASLLAVDAAREKGVRRVYVNPGTESPELIRKIRELGMDPIEACSIRSIGADPGGYAD